MQIANPIYDVVFKFLMDDNKVAKSFIQAIMGREIVELELMPQEMVISLSEYAKTDKEKPKKKPKSVKKSLGLTIYRIDFSAKIKTETGEIQQVIIELQKARLLNTIPRFREYLGNQYANPDLNVSLKTLNARTYKVGIPIFAIYFLGYELDNFKKSPVILINNCVQDRFSKENLAKNEPFITSLFHEGIIVNIPALKGKRRDAIETLLSIFDQSNREENFHILNVNENDFPEIYRHIIRRLQTAYQSKEVRAKMNVEDEFLSELQEAERAKEEAENAKKETEQVRKEVLQAKKEAKKAQEEAQKAQEALEEEFKARIDAEKMADLSWQKIIFAVKSLAQQVQSTETIAKIFGISEDEVKNILAKK